MNRPGTRRATPLGRSALTLATLLILVACQGQGAASNQSTPSASTASSSEESASATETASAGATGSCVDQAVIDAIDEIDSGNFDTQPTLSEVADALDTLELEGDQATARDGFVQALRADPVEETRIVSAALNLRANLALDAC
jgi:hypothetical protein